MESTIALLRDRGIQPTPQRIAVAQCVLGGKDHPSADEVWERVRRTCPTVSRATVFSALHLFVEKGLVRMQILKPGVLVYDSTVEPHHHFIDEATGEVHDVPWDAVRVRGQDSLRGFQVRDYQVVMRGRRKE
ncbi:MAG: transcriptional repressor [Planctomycetes bacterium]|nr:transcriptional repressor [Planctomycetota bacterium]